LVVTNWRYVRSYDRLLRRWLTRPVLDRWVFEGGIGVAPSWGTGTCNGTCQSWVSACVAARLNATGTSVPISLRGSHNAIRMPFVEETTTFINQEAGFGGQIFQPGPPDLWACTGKQIDDGTISERGVGYLHDRLCAAGADCGVRVVGSCQDKCGTYFAGWYAGCQATSSPFVRTNNVVTTYLDSDDVGSPGAIQ
jgi:hypothetical protein